MIEAIRILENGKTIHMLEVFNDHISIDAIEDFIKAETLINKK